MFKKKKVEREFPGHPMVGTRRFDCQGLQGSIPGWGTKILQPMQHGQKKKSTKNYQQDK